MTVLLALWLALAGAGGPTPAAPPTAVTLGPAWTTVPLPEEPLGIFAHNGDLWVVGADEMVAVSTDGGLHWSVRHTKRGSAMLFAMSAAGPHDLVAYGSDGVWMESRDGGRSWRTHGYAPMAALYQVRMFAGHHGFAIGPNVFGSTSNGSGWQMRLLSRGTLEELAALDGRRAVALCEGCATGAPMAPARPGGVARQRRSPSSGANALLFTTDGGRHWKLFALSPSVRWTTLRADGGAYALYGMMGRAPVVARSSDGQHWTLGASSLADVSDCTGGGCWLNSGGWADLSGPAPKVWAVPCDCDSPVSTGWAGTGQTICRISVTLRCALTRTPWRQPPPVAKAITPHRPEPKFRIARCIRCPAPAYPRWAQQSGDEGTVSLQAIIGRNGRIRQLKVRAAPTAELAQAAFAAVRTWIYRPLLLNGKPRGVDTRITVNFHLRR